MMQGQAKYRGNGSQKNRLDTELVRLGLAASREKARALIMAGQVLVRGQLVDRPDFRVAPGWVVEVRQPFPYVSRGALKIGRAIQYLGLSVAGIHILDIGISTGGFSDYLLQKGAARITGVDVTISQVADRLRQDPRVGLLEKNARTLRREDVQPAPDLIVVDLSFISILKVLPALKAFGPVPILVLIKPQFEAERGKVGKGGVLRQDGRRREILLRLKHAVEALGFSLLGSVPAGIPGKRGNQEYFFLLRHCSEPSISDEQLEAQTTTGNDAMPCPRVQLSGLCDRINEREKR